MSQAEYGHWGHAALVKKYGQRQVNAWLRKGGRKKDPTFDEIMASTVKPSRKRAS